MNTSKQTLKDKLQVTLVDAIQRRDIKKALQVSSLLKLLNKGKK